LEKNKTSFLLIPYYTGLDSLEDVLREPRARGLLWLEILFNDQVPWEDYLDKPEIQSAYQKACIWYSHFKTMVLYSTRRKPLKTKTGPIDEKDYRKFLEALNFVSD
jgi:hypothetical protein